MVGATVSAGVSEPAASVSLDLHVPWWGPGRETLLAELDTIRRRLQADADERWRRLLEELATTQVRLDELETDGRAALAWPPPALPVSVSALSDIVRWLEAQVRLAEEQLRQFQSEQAELVSEWVRMKDPIHPETVRIAPQELAAAEKSDEMLSRDRRQLAVTAEEADRFLETLTSACEKSLSRVRQELTPFVETVRESATDVVALQDTSRTLAALLESYDKELTNLAVVFAELRADGQAAAQTPPSERIRGSSLRLASAVELWQDAATEISRRVADLVERMADDVPERTPAIVLQNRFQQRVHRLTRAHRELAAAARALMPASNHRLDGQLRSLAGLERRVLKRAELVRDGLLRRMAAVAEAQRQRNLKALEPRIAALPPVAARRIERLLASRENLVLVSSMLGGAQALDDQHRAGLQAAELAQRQAAELERNMTDLLARWSPIPVVQWTALESVPPAPSSLAAQWLPAALTGGLAFVLSLGVMAWWDAVRLGGRRASSADGTERVEGCSDRGDASALASLTLHPLPAAPAKPHPAPAPAKPPRRQAAR